MKMTTKNIIAILVLLFCQNTYLNAQIRKGDIKVNETVNAEINTGEKHLYKIKLGKNQFVLFKIQQIGVDAVITTYDASGRKIEDFDSPNGSYGPEFVTITSTQEGEYGLEISTLENGSRPGKYELSVQKIKPKAVTVSERVDELLAQYDYMDAPGVAVSIVKDGKIVYQKGFGMANLEYNIPITPTSVFHIASVSKQFTAFCILLLEKEGKLSLNDDIRKYLPELTDFGYKITIRNLMNHTSGLRDQGDLIRLSGIRMDDVITNEQVMKLITRQKETNFIAGSEYEYCNSGYVLLAQIVERVSGQKFSEFAKERIFIPLKMNHSEFLDDNERIIKNKAYSYTTDKNSLKKSSLNFSFVGSTGLNTTVEDLSLWALNFENSIVGDTTIFDKMKERSTLNNGEKISYALGQEVKNYKGLDVIFHGGGDAGYRAYLLRIPEQKFSVIVLSNSEAFNPLDVVYKIVDYYLESKLVEEKPAARSEDFFVKEATLKSYNGDYEIMPGLIFTITNNSKNLELEVSGNNQKIELEAISENEFLIKGRKDKLSFYKTNGQISFLKFRQADFEYKGKKILIKPFDESKVELSEYTGRYYSPELETEYIFTIRDNRLIATHFRNDDIKMRAFQTDIFLSNERFFRKVEFIRNEQSKIVGCKVSGARAIIKFEKVE